MPLARPTALEKALKALGLVLAVMSGPLTVVLLAASGCGGGGKGAAGPAASPSVSVKPPPTVTAPPDGGPSDAPAAEAGASTNADVGIWGPVLAAGDAAPATSAADAAAAPCWKGFTPTGNAEADVAELGHRCAQGMAPLIPPVKHTFKAGESKSIPVPIVPGCYRVIAVGGKGVKDVDLALKDQSGKIVAADMTPDDVFPMIHPNKEFCAEAVQFLNFVISVKKGSGDVAGGVWKR
ncbi:MAG: hypothetical protein HYV09_07090 [Deltaproteobacteria bacterium]|nr:hypothetical protein [Deltaproteobacteria bacterium]